MENPRLAGRYAKSLIDLAVERNQLEDVYNDMKFLRSTIKGSRELANLLKSPVISTDKKLAILNQIAQGRITDLTAAFNRLLLEKNREEALPEIIEAYIDQYNQIKGIHKVKLTTAIAISDDVKNTLLNKIRRDTALQNIELETKQDESLIGGFVLEFHNNLLDASVQRDLREIRSQFENNSFVLQIR